MSGRCRSRLVKLPRRPSRPRRRARPFCICTPAIRRRTVVRPRSRRLHTNSCLAITTGDRMRSLTSATGGSVHIEPRGAARRTVAFAKPECVPAQHGNDELRHFPARPDRHTSWKHDWEQPYLRRERQISSSAIRSAISSASSKRSARSTVRAEHAMLRYRTPLQSGSFSSTKNSLDLHSSCHGRYSASWAASVAEPQKPRVHERDRRAGCSETTTDGPVLAAGRFPDALRNARDDGRQRKDWAGRFLRFSSAAVNSLLRTRSR